MSRVPFASPNRLIPCRLHPHYRGHSDLCALVAEIRAGRHTCSPLRRSSRPARLPVHTTPSCSNCSKQGAFQGDTPIPAFKVQCDTARPPRRSISTTARQYRRRLCATEAGQVRHTSGQPPDPRPSGKGIIVVALTGTTNRYDQLIPVPRVFRRQYDAGCGYPHGDGAQAHHRHRIKGKRQNIILEAVAAPSVSRSRWSAASPADGSGEFESASGLIGEPRSGLLGAAGGMIVENQLDRRIGRDTR
jgi:hypothetical protein